MATSHTPKTINYYTEATTAFAEATTVTGSAQVIYGACVLAPFSVSGTHYPDGFLATVVQHGSALQADVFSLRSGTKVAALGHAIASGVFTIWGIFPLPQSLRGYVLIYETGDGVPVFKVIRADGQTSTAGQTFVTDAILDYSHAPRSPIPAFHTAEANVSVNVNGGHVRFFREGIAYSTGVGMITQEWKKNYSTSDFAWAADPDTCLAVQDLHDLANAPGSTVALLGLQSTPLLYTGQAVTLYTVTAPRLAIIKGGPSGDGSVIASRAAGDGRAHGMVVNQFNEIYVVGTKSLVGEDANLIEKYSVNNLNTPMATVEHLSDGLGAKQTVGNHGDTLICRPTWDGSRLIVQDHDDDETRLFIYNRDLVFIGSYQISNTTGAAMAGGTPIHGSYLRTSFDKFASPWMGASL